MTLTTIEKAEVKGLVWQPMAKPQVSPDWGDVVAKFTLPQIWVDSVAQFKAVPYSLGYTKPVVDYTPAMPVYRGKALVEQFMSVLEEVVREAGPHHCYTPHRQDDGRLTPTYIHDGEGDCLVGRVLLRMGHSVEALQRWEGTNAGDVISRLYPASTPGVNDMAYVAQTVQRLNDTRMPWGMALEQGRAHARAQAAALV